MVILKIDYHEHALRAMANLPLSFSLFDMSIPFLFSTPDLTERDLIRLSGSNCFN
jgi:hypothetical protein